MAEASSAKRRDGKRFTDVSKEPDKPLPPLQKFTSEPLLPLQDAVKSLQKHVEDLMTYVTKSLNKCKYPEDGLTQNESAALYLYSLQWPEGQHSFYTMFNRALRHEDRTKLVPYHSYLHLFMTALEKLPSIQDRVWRGVNGDISGQYKPKSVHVWWGASSCSDMVQETDTFLDKKSDRTLFNIKCYEGKMIKNHSKFPNESEIVLPPGTCLRVKSVSNPASKLHIIDMEQIPYEEPSSEITLSSVSSSSSDHRICLIWLDGSVNKSKDNIETQEQLRQLNTKFETFEKPNQCENFIQQSVTSSRIVLIVGGQIGRQIVTDIHDFFQLKTIFVFCMNKVENEKWAKNHNKIKAVIVHSKELIQQVKEEVAVQVQQEQLEHEAAAQAQQKHGAGSISSGNTGFTDMTEEPPCMLVPTEGYQREPLLPLEEAVQPVAELVPDVDQMVKIAKKNCRKPSSGLTQDESASIHIYTMEWNPHENSLYFVLNAALRSEDRLKAKPWFRYLKLVLTALDKLPPFRGTVWYGVREDLSAKYSKGDTCTWWGFTSTTLNMQVLESTSIGQHGTRTIFSIQCRNGKDIREHSMYQNEEEIMLMPGFHFKVLSQINLGNGLCMINVDEVDPPFSLVQPPFYASK